MNISGHLTEHSSSATTSTPDEDLREAADKVAAYVASLPSTTTVTPTRAVQ
jgi:hypothetical protein